MLITSRNAAVLWTGGKDSALALYEAHLSEYPIKYLITFAPANPNFLAHPLQFIKLQAAALQIPHLTIEITPPYKESYIDALKNIKEEYDIDMLITGDIDEVAGHPNFISECAEEANIDVFMPLWKKSRKEVMSKFFEYNIKWIFSLVKSPFTEEWVGENFDHRSYKNLLAFADKMDIDLCGENGEYHSLVLAHPLFKQQICIASFTKEQKDAMAYINIGDIVLQ